MAGKPRSLRMKKRARNIYVQNVGSHILQTLNELQKAVGIWQNETFGYLSTAEAKFAHLKKEVKELGENLDDPIEAADCVLLILGIAECKGYSLWDALQTKFEINKNRKWGLPDADGSVQHIEE